MKGWITITDWDWDVVLRDGRTVIYVMKPVVIVAEVKVTLFFSLITFKCKAGLDIVVKKTRREVCVLCA